MNTQHRPERVRSLTLYSLIGLGAAGVLLCVPATSALAATATTSFDVVAQVHSSCTISADTMDFGSYDPTHANTDTTSHMSVTCDLGDIYTVGLSAGKSGDPDNRTMKSGTKLLNYALFRDSGYSEKWGPLGGSLNVVGPKTATGSPESLTVYGRIPGGQYPGTGIYTDTIIATVSY